MKKNVEAILCSANQTKILKIESASLRNEINKSECSSTQNREMSHHPAIR